MVWLDHNLQGRMLAHLTIGHDSRHRFLVPTVHFKLEAKSRWLTWTPTNCLCVVLINGVAKQTQIHATGKVSGGADHFRHTKDYSCVMML